jgi:lipopolysaccharide transport system permease protein
MKKKNKCGELVRNLLRNHSAIRLMTIREIKDRYNGQIFGVFWAVFHPALIVGTFLFAFRYILKTRMGGMDLPFGDNGYSIFLISGLIPWLAIQEILNRSPSIIVSSSPMIRQIIFPLEVLPVKIVLAVIPTILVAFSLQTLYAVLVYQRIPWTYLLFFPLLSLLLVWGIGMSFLLSTIGVFFRDIKDIVQAFSFLAIYILPILFPPQALPDFAVWVFRANPLSYIIWCFQDAFYYGRFQHPWAWPCFVALSIGTFVLGASLFSRCRPIFGRYV